MEKPVFDKEKILNQFNYLTKRFDLDVYLRIANSGSSGLYETSKKFITLNQNKPCTNFWEDNSKYMSWTFVLCHEIRHAILFKKRIVVDDCEKMERRYKGKIVFKHGDPWGLKKYINFPDEKDCNKFAKVWERRLERLGI